MPFTPLLEPFRHVTPATSLRHFIRTTKRHLRPPKPRLWEPPRKPARQRALARGLIQPGHLASIFAEHRLRRKTPTIVIGGFVPDAIDTVFLQRSFFLGQGSLFYLLYPRQAFSADAIYAQLDDLVEHLAVDHAQPPVIVSISFGAGLVMEWLRRRKEEGRPARLGGLILVSPVSTPEDIIDPSLPKPNTLLGRGLAPFLQQDADVYDAADLARSRGIFMKMFEAGAQNTSALRSLVTGRELLQLRNSVRTCLAEIDGPGASQRIRALLHLNPLARLDPGEALCETPALVLYAEKESSVMVSNAPTRQQLETHVKSIFPQGSFHLVRNPHGGSPVQHASLLFHERNFRPYFKTFYAALENKRTNKVMTDRWFSLRGPRPVV